MIYVYGDGSCGVKNRTGAYGTVVVTAKRTVLLSGVECPSTVNRCEIKAIIAGLQWIGANVPMCTGMPVQVVSDSEVSIRLLGGEYTPGGNLADLVAQYKSLAPQFQVHLMWIERNSTEYMEQADALAFATREHNKKTAWAFYTREERDEGISHS